MTLLNPINAEIVRLLYVDGVPCRAIARQVSLAASTVCRVGKQFRCELTCILGRLDNHTPAALRDLTIRLLFNAEYARQVLAAPPRRGRAKTAGRPA